MMPERWLELSVRVPSAELTSELAEGLLTLGGAAVQETHDRLITFVPEPESVTDLLDRARALLGRIAPDPLLALQWRWQEDQDWAEKWRRGLTPRRVGGRFIVTPPWADPKPGSRDLVLVIEPKMAFGTGEHGTTRGALRMLERACRAGDRVLDVGTGTAILAIAAARLGASRVLAVEADAEALPNARENLDRNGVADRVRLRLAVVDEPFLRALGIRFDLIVANVLSSVLRPLLPSFRRSLSGGIRARARPGRVILGGILDTEVDAMLGAAAAADLSVIAEDRDGEWWTGLFQAASG